MKAPEWVRPERDVREASIRNITAILERDSGRSTANRAHLAALRRLLRLYKGGMKRA